VEAGGHCPGPTAGTLFWGMVLPSTAAVSRSTPSPIPDTCGPHKMAHPYQNMTPSESFKSSPKPQPRRRSSHRGRSSSKKTSKSTRHGVAQSESRVERTTSSQHLSAALQLANTSTASPGSSERVRTHVLDDQQTFSLVGAALGARLCMLPMPDDAPPQTCSV
jgi:hypothetical protein